MRSLQQTNKHIDTVITEGL